jgi:hypothetical protein
LRRCTSSPEGFSRDELDVGERGRRELAARRVGKGGGKELKIYAPRVHTLKRPDRAQPSCAAQGGGGDGGGGREEGHTHTHTCDGLQGKRGGGGGRERDKTRPLTAAVHVGRLVYIHL